MRKLRKLLKDFDEEDITVSDSDELMKLAWAVNLKASKFLDLGLINYWEAILLFLS